MRLRASSSSLGNLGMSSAAPPHIPRKAQRWAFFECRARLAVAHPIVPARSPMWSPAWPIEVPASVLFAPLTSIVQHRLRQYGPGGTPGYGRACAGRGTWAGHLISPPQHCFPPCYGVSFHRAVPRFLYVTAAGSCMVCTAWGPNLAGYPVWVAPSGLLRLGSDLRGGFRGTPLCGAAWLNENKTYA